MMKRPLAVAGFSYLTALLAASFFSFWGIVAAAVLAVGIGIASLFKDRTKTIFIACAVFAAGLAVYSAYQHFYYDSLQVLDGQTVQVKGTLTGDVDSSSGVTKMKLRVNEVDGKGVFPSFSVLVSCYTEVEIDPYDGITAQVKLYLPKAGYSFDAYSYYKSKGIYFTGYIKEVPAVEHAAVKSPEYYLTVLRQNIQQSIKNILPGDQGDLLAGMFFGDKSGIPDSVISDFQRIGISHILAVSGLHVTIIAQFLLGMLLAMGLSKRLSGILCCVGIWLFVALTGFVPSAVRAGVMATACYGAFWLGRDADSLNSLGLALLIILFFNPFGAADVGLLLSFFATLGIIVLSPRVKRMMYRRLGGKNKLLDNTLAILAQTAGAVLFTLPVLLFYFGQVSLISPLANILIVPLCPFFLISGIGMAVAGLTPILEPLAKLLGFVCGLMGSLILWLSRMISGIPGILFSMGSDYIKIWAAICLLLLAAVVLFKNRGVDLKKQAAFSMAAVFCCGVFSYQAANFSRIDTAVFNTEYGPAVVVTQRNSAVIACHDLDYSTALRIESYLRGKGVDTVDSLIFTSRDAVYDGASIRLANSFFIVRYAAVNAVSFTQWVNSHHVISLGQAKITWGSVSLEVSVGTGETVDFSWGEMTLALRPGGDTATLGSATVIVTGSTQTTKDARCDYLVVCKTDEDTDVQTAGEVQIVALNPYEIVSLRANGNSVMFEDVWHETQF